MAVIFEKMRIECPLCDAERHLESFFRKHVTRSESLNDKHSVRFPIIKDHDVDCTLMRLPPPPSARHRIAIEWEAVDRPFPSFAGNLCITPADDGDGAFELVLTGVCKSPAGALGHLFETSAGQNVASDAIRHLLARMRQVIEQAHQAEVSYTAATASRRSPAAE
jgi:hypothetical protein